MTVTDRTTPAQFVTALKTQLAARLAADALFDTVTVYLAPPSQDISLDDTIVLVTGRIIEEAEYIHPNYDRDVLTMVPGWVQTYSPGDLNEDALHTAMDRCTAILAEIVEELRDSAPNVGRGTRQAILSRVGWEPVPLERGGWVCRANTEITYRARVA